MPKPSRSNAGNIFLALFGAMAVAGLLGATLTLVMKGPLSSSVTLTRQNTAEAQMALGGRAVVMAAASLPNTGDCDGDGMVEPFEWRAAGGLLVPVGGGLIPDKLMPSNTDPWGTEYGYCAWDHGSTTLNASCRTGASNARLAGANIKSAPIVAIISAGPDKKFTTTCRTFAAADVSGNGLLGDPTDLPVVGKAALSDDDIIFTYTYDEAVGVSGGLWSLKPAAPNTAVISKDLEVSGGASFSETGLFQKIGKTVAPVPANCSPHSATYYNDLASGHCYYVATSPLNWTAAKAACEANGDYLATISSEAENTIIGTKLGLAAGNILWIGGTDAAVEGEWRWTGGEVNNVQFWQGSQTGSPVGGQFSKWTSGKPSNGSSNNCLAFNGGVRTWHDGSCTSSIRYICEKSPLTVSSPLEIEKGLKLATPAQMPNCNALNKSATRQNAAGDGLEICDGSAWKAIGGGSPPVPAIVPTTFDAGYSYTCAIKEDGTNWCWGSNDFGRFGTGNTTQTYVPTQTAGPVRWKEISGSMAGMTCGIGTDNNGYCWGDNDYGQLGDGTSTDRLLPTAIPGLEGIIQISAGNIHGCAIKADETAVCWGDNTSGGVGSPSPPDQRPYPVSATGAKWKQVSAGHYYSCGIKTDGTAWCWGENTNGKLGIGSTTLKDVPTAVSTTGVNTWSQISTGYNHACGIKTDGTGWCWGNNGSGRLGDNTTTNRTTPVTFGAGPWKQVSAGESHSCALTSGGDAYCWGYNEWGRLGDGTTTLSLVPKKVIGGLEPYISISSSVEHSCAMKNDGKVYCWGFGYYGNLGQGNQNNSSTPITQSGNPVFRVPALAGDAGIFPLLAPDGSSFAPSYSFVNATSTGLYYGSNTVQVKSANGIDVNAFGQADLSPNTMTTDFRISIDGGLKLGNDSKPCATDIRGTLRYSGSKKFEYCNGSNWVAFNGAAGGANGNCDGLGEMSYNDTASGHCYYKTNIVSSWVDAQTACQANGAYLAVISSAAEFDLIIANLAIPGDASVVYWLGGSDSAVEGQWRWMGGELSGTQFWQGNETGSAVNSMYNAWISGSNPTDSDASFDCMFGGSYSSYGIPRVWGNLSCNMGFNGSPTVFSICEKGM